MYLYNKGERCRIYRSFYIKKETKIWNIISKRIPYKRNIRDYREIVKKDNPLNITCNY